MAYNFQEKNGNVEIYENGQRISTATPAYAKSAYGYGGTTPVITSDTLTQGQNAIDVPSYNGLSSQDMNSVINAAIAGAKTPTPTVEARPEDTTMARTNELMAQLGITESKPTSLTGLYSEQISNPEYVAKQKAVDDLNAQMAALTAEAEQLKLNEQRIPIELQEQSTGRGITKGGLAPIEAGELRKNALKSLDLAYRTLPVSAQLNAAQGRLQLAQSNINTLLGLQEKDQTATREWNNMMYERASAQATREQQAKLDAWNDKNKIKEKEASDLLELKRTYVAEAIKQGDYNSAAKIAAGKTMEEVNAAGAMIKGTPETWSAPYLLGGDYVQKNSKTGQIRIAVDVPVSSSASDKPLSVLDVQRYNELYPEANVIAGDTEKTANDKVAKINTPEAKTRSLVQAARDAGNSYDVVVNEIKNDATIKDKETALKIANEVFGLTETTTIPTTPQYGIGNFSKIDITERKQQLEKMGFTASQVKAQLKDDGYSIDAISSVGAGNLIDQITSWIFKE